MQLEFVIRAIFCAVVIERFIYVILFYTLYHFLCYVVFPLQAIIFTKLSFRVIEFVEHWDGKKHLWCIPKFYRIIVHSFESISRKCACVWMWEKNPQNFVTILLKKKSLIGEKNQQNKNTCIFKWNRTRWGICGTLSVILSLFVQTTETNGPFMFFSDQIMNHKRHIHTK